MSILTKKFMLELKLHILKLHRKAILQQTPSSDTPTSGMAHPPVFSTCYGGQLLKKKKEEKKSSPQNQTWVH